MPADYEKPPTAYFSPTEGYFVASRDNSNNLLRVTGRRAVTFEELPSDAYALVPDIEEPGADEHHIERADRWVAVQFRNAGPVLVLHDDGTVTERFTMPNDVAHLPLGGAA